MYWLAALLACVQSLALGTPADGSPWAAREIEAVQRMRMGHLCRDEVSRLETFRMAAGTQTA